MDTPIYDQVLAELLAHLDMPAWPTVELDPPPEPGDLPTERHFVLPREVFVEWPAPVHERGAGTGLFRTAVVASVSRGRAA